MSRDQKRARWFGALFLITFVTSILALVVYETVLRHPVSYIAGAGHDNQVLFAALLELLLIIANIGTAVVIFPIVRRQNEELALGYVAVAERTRVSGVNRKRRLILASFGWLFAIYDRSPSPSAPWLLSSGSLA